ncbi:DUF4403 family protein [Algoriphagus aestuarii]|nr:DUF4403 family protein [Algoriphagus aestuarii]
MKIQTNRIYLKSFSLITLVLICLASCKSFNPSTKPEPIIAPPAFSSVNVPVQIPQATLYKIMNQSIPAVLIEDDQLSMGNVEGKLKLSRNGNPSYTALDSQKIQLTLPLKIEGQIGLQRKGLGNLIQSKLPLNESISPVIVVNPTINPDWSVSFRDFELIDLGGQINLDVLGMSVDLSGILKKEIQKWGEENLNSSKSLVSLKTLVDLAWNQVGKPFTINWEGEKTAFSIQPESVKLNEFFDQNENLNLWLGLEGKVNTHPANAAPSRAFPLPKITENASSDNILEITLPWVLSYQKLDELLGNNLNNVPIRVDKKTILTPNNIQSQAFGEFLEITMDFFAEQTNGKSLNGKLFIIGKPAFDPDSQSLYFTDINFKMESGNLGAQTSVGLKKRKIINQIEKRAVFPIGSTLEESISSIEDRLRLNTGIADLRITNLEVNPENFYPTKNGLTVHIKAKGNVNFDWK